MMQEKQKVGDAANAGSDVNNDYDDDDDVDLVDQEEE